MSQTFTLTGKGNVLSATYFPPIDLDPKCQYGLGLVGFYGCNSIRNIHEGNNKFYYMLKNGSTKMVTIPPGAYELAELGVYINTAIGSYLGAVEFTLTANHNTLQCEMKSTYKVLFQRDDAIGHMLGFEPGIYEANKKHISQMPVQIFDATNIQVECNITGGAYRNNKQAHTIFEFDVHVEPGYKLVKEPASIIYLPVIVDRIDNITLRLTNQEGKLVDFGAEKASIRLELKKYGA